MNPRFISIFLLPLHVHAVELITSDPFKACIKGLVVFLKFIGCVFKSSFGWFYCCGHWVLPPKFNTLCLTLREESLICKPSTKRWFLSHVILIGRKLDTEINKFLFSAYWFHISIA